SEAQGLKPAAVEKLVRTAETAPRDPPDIRFVGDRRVDVGSGKAPKGGAEVWLIRYDPRDQEIAIKRGDNPGETVVHKDVVREVKRLGLWRGRPQAFRINPADDGLKTVVVVQAPKGGRILGVAQPKA